MTATVDPITETGAWSARAAAGDALSRVDDGSPFVAIWIGEDGGIRYSKAGTTRGDLALLGNYLLWLSGHGWEV